MWNAGAVFLGTVGKKGSGVRNCRSRIYEPVNINGYKRGC